MTAHGDAEPPVNLDEIFKEVEGRTHIKRESVASMMGIPLAQLSQQIHGTGHVSFGRLLSMWKHEDPDGRKFVECMFTVTKERMGMGELDPLTDALLTATVALTGKFRQLKASLSEERKRGIA
jgi:hypothetical protein